MSGPTFADLSPGVVVEGPILPEPVEVLAIVPMGPSIKVIGKGLRTGQVRDPILDAAQLAQLRLTPKEPLFDGDALHFKLGVEAARLGLAYEYDPYWLFPQQRPVVTPPANGREGTPGLWRASIHV